MEITLFQGLWFLLIFVLIAGYFVLDGFDLGIGVLYPFIAKNDSERAVLRRSIGPVWDGNEVWLLTAGGALFAAYPAAYATTFSGFYLAVMLVLFGLIIRAVSLEFRHYDSAWGRLWDICFFLGSLLPALLLGVAVGNILAGIPMNSNGDYAGIPLLGLITPFTLLCGLLGLLVCVAQGAAWISLKASLDSRLYCHAKKIRTLFQTLTLIVFLAVSAYALLLIQPEMTALLSPLRIAFAVLIVGGIAVSLTLGCKNKCDSLVFLAQSLSAASLVGLLAASLYPNLVVASTDSVGVSITIANAASSELTLMWMTIFTCIGLPLVLVYHVVIYRTFKGRLTNDDLTGY